MDQFASLLQELVSTLVEAERPCPEAPVGPVEGEAKIATRGAAPTASKVRHWRFSRSWL